MKLHFDQRTGALHLRLDDTKILESEEVMPGIVLDYDDRNQVVGIEILNAATRVSLEDLKRLELEVA